MSKRSLTKHIVIHCSATRASQDIGVAEIAKWHTDKGWADVGYNFVIRRDGTIEEGRNLSASVDAFEEIGAHVANHNSQTLGICLVGGCNDKLQPQNNFTDKQWASLAALVGLCTRKFPDANVLGHRDIPGVAKACPSFEVKPWWVGVQANGEHGGQVIVKQRDGQLKTYPGVTVAAPGKVKATTVAPLALGGLHGKDQVEASYIQQEVVRRDAKLAAAAADTPPPSLPRAPGLENATGEELRAAYEAPVVSTPAPVVETPAAADPGAPPALA